MLFALADSQKRFNIPLELLEKLVHGTAMDVPTGLRSEAAGEPQLQYETFDQLYDYCYHVASVVGLVCIRIFGYRDPQAEDAGGKGRSRVSADQHPSRRERRCRSGPRVPAARGFLALWHRLLMP